MREEHFDFLSQFAGDSVLGGFGDTARHIAGRFIDGHQDFSRRIFRTASGASRCLEGTTILFELLGGKELKQFRRYDSGKTA